MSPRSRRQHRSGGILVLTAFMMVVMFCVIAFAVDIGYLQVVRSQLQSSADAAALAAAWDLIDEDAVAGDSNPDLLLAATRQTAGEYAGLNKVAGGTPALAIEDVQIGQLENPYDPNAVMSFLYPSRYNAIQVRVRKTEAQNGAVSLFFARIMGINSADQQARATAVFLNNVSGFTTPSTGENLPILPLALDKETWDDMLDGVGTDDWTWDGEQVTAGSDDILEVNLFPQDTGSPGNRGTVDIGRNSNSARDIARQILEGVSPEDMAAHGGTLEFDVNGELELNGDTGVSAGVKDELSAIMGEPRIILIFSEVAGPGNNAQYTIVESAGIRIMEVKLTGNVTSKRVIVQPAIIEIPGGIPGTGAPKSHFVHSPVWLIR